MLLSTRRALLGAGEYRSSDVPQAEADALIAFYSATGGPAWTNKQGWGWDPVVNNWFGVTVAGGHVTAINVNTNNLVGAAGDTLDPLASSLSKLECYVNSLTSLDISTLTALTDLRCYDNSISVLDVSSLTSLTLLYCYLNSISVLDVSSLTSLTNLRCQDNSISILDVSAITPLGTFRCQDNAMSEAEVDTIVQAIYDNWAAYTDATPVLNISGSNSAPSGVYQDGDPPTTGKEYIYEIVNDPESTGNEVWSVTYTA